MGGWGGGWQRRGAPPRLEAHIPPAACGRVISPGKRPPASQRREGVESEAAEVSGGRRSYGRSPSLPGIPVLSDGAQRRVFSPCAVTDVVSHDEFGIFLCCCSTRLFTFVDLSPIFSCQDLGFGIDFKKMFLLKL